MKFDTYVNIGLCVFFAACLYKPLMHELPFVLQAKSLPDYLKKLGIMILVIAAIAFLGEHIHLNWSY